MKVIEIPINEIKIPKSYAKLKADGAVDKLDPKEMADSIEANGLLQPICVTENDGEYSLVYGKNRLEGFKRLKRKTIPAVVRKDLEELDSVIMQLTENIVTNNRKLLDFGRHVNMLENDYKIKREEVSKRTGRSIGYIVQALNVYNAFHKKDHKKVKAAASDSVLKKLANGINNGYIKPTQAKEIAETVKTGLVKAKDVNNVINNFRKENNLEVAVKKNHDVLHISVTIPIHKKDFDKNFGSPLKMATAVKKMFYSEFDIEEPNYRA